MCGGRWLLVLSCDQSVMYINVESLYSIPEPNIILLQLYFNKNNKKCKMMCQCLQTMKNDLLKYIITVINAILIHLFIYFILTWQNCGQHTNRISRVSLGDLPD